MSILSDRLFIRDGFAMARGALTAIEAARMCETARALCASLSMDALPSARLDIPKVPRDGLTRLMDTGVRALLGRLFGTPMDVFSLIYYSNSGATAPHIHSLYTHMTPQHPELTLWIPFAPIDADCGSIALYPGSHLEFESTVRDFLRENPDIASRAWEFRGNRAGITPPWCYQTQNRLERFLGKTRDAAAARTMEGRPGDVLVFNNHVVHRSDAWGTDRARPALVIGVAERASNRWFIDSFFYSLFDDRSAGNAIPMTRLRIGEDVFWQDPDRDIFGPFPADRPSARHGVEPIEPADTASQG